MYHRVGVVGDGEVNRFLDQMGEGLLEMSDILPVERFHAVTQTFCLAFCRTFLCTSNRKWMTNTSINFYFSTTSTFLAAGTDVRCGMDKQGLWDLTSHIRT